jgi:murein DD-endopeptidase MepM/ murein hydrolase activator NlpD
MQMPTNDAKGTIKIIAIAALVLILLVGVFIQLILTVITSILGGDQAQKEEQKNQDIPFQALYQEVAKKYPSVPWTILAAVHKYSDVYDIHMTALSGTAATLKGKDKEVLDLIDKYAKPKGIDPLLVAGLIQQESNWDPKARSGATGCGNGARGLMQVMPCHFESKKLNADTDGYDPEQNIKLGTEILASCIKQFVATDVALACYNGGPGAVKNGQVPSSPKETAEYPGKVLGYYHQFQNESSATEVSKDDKNKVSMDDVKKWLDKTAKSLAEQVRLQSDSSRSSGTCTKTAKQKREKGATLGTFSYPVTCAVFYTAPPKESSNDDATWEYTERVEKKSQEYLGDNGPASFGNLVMAGGALPMPTTAKISISSKFGCRIHPVTGVYKFHYGDDIPIPTGTPVISVMDGKVEYSKNDNLIGHSVMIDHGKVTVSVNGQKKQVNFKTRYLHMISVSVKPGQQVKQGQIIAKSGGAQGIVYSTGAHLHFEVYIDGNVSNPYPMLTGKDDHPNLTCAHSNVGY